MNPLHSILREKLERGLDEAERIKSLTNRELAAELDAIEGEGSYDLQVDVLRAMAVLLDGAEFELRNVGDNATDTQALLNIAVCRRQGYSIVHFNHGRMTVKPV